MSLTHQIAWFRIGAEGMAIVVSILLAFGIQAWWDARLEREELRAVLALVDGELGRNTEQLETSIEAHRGVLSTLDAMREAGSWFGLDNPLIPVEVFNPSTGALGALTTSGLLGQIPNLELRVLLSSLPGTLADLVEKEARVLDRRELARNRLASLGVRMAGMPRGPRGGVSVADIASDHPFYTDTELLNLLIMRRLEEQAVVEAGEVLLGHFHQIRAELAEADPSTE